ncbi:hypothetical protein OJF2_52500 [Aquisphaera giovannonii]|uniref:PEP-CTERM protein-sorting domain-containing protein n=1 Tax=Aquisphaera giovannonii TaxID=406548 RepID=A0A5B9W9B0_9BACT|nr:hypothetical protein [Aquisphaera giovannonii]QEH36665.1 hypothetical protein OJF2_52500 [Aquisphaera giovannonii]
MNQLIGRFSMAAAMLFVAAGMARAGQITTLYSTGVADDGSALANGAIDPHYTLTSTPGGSGYGPTAYVADDTKYPLSGGPWVGNLSDARWIGPVADQTTISGVTGSGYYVYKTTFDLTGFDPSTAHISGQWSSDNPGEIYLNGVDTGIGTTGEYAYQSLHSLDIATGFIAGINTLEFRIYNIPISSNNPTGVIAQLCGTAAVPEPSSAALGLIAIVGGLAVRKGMRGVRRPKG